MLDSCLILPTIKFDDAMIDGDTKTGADTKGYQCSMI